MGNLENDLRPELQPTPSYTVGDDVAGKSIAAVTVELVSSELSDTIRNVRSLVYVLYRYTQPLVVKQVESVRLELYRDPLRHPSVLINAHVDGADRLTLCGVSAHSQEWRTEDRGGRRVVDNPMSSRNRSNGALARDSAAAYAPLSVSIHTD